MVGVKKWWEEKLQICIFNTFYRTRNDIIAGNGRVQKFYFFIVWLYLFKKYTK